MREADTTALDPALLAALEELNRLTPDERTELEQLIAAARQRLARAASVAAGAIVAEPAPSALASAGDITTSADLAMASVATYAPSPEEFEKAVARVVGELARTKPGRWSPEVQAALIKSVSRVLAAWLATSGIKVDMRGAFGGEYHEAPAAAVAPAPSRAPAPQPGPGMYVMHSDPASVRALSPLARVVLDVLRIAPGTAEELALETKIPAAVVDAALAELVSVGRAVEVEPRTFKAR
jgi:hypothetical protein